jgi:hypothetical protein
MKSIKKRPNTFHTKYGGSKKDSILLLLKIKEIWITLGFVGGIFVLYFLAETFIPHKHHSLNSKVIEKISSTEIEEITANISSKFVCNCGQCSRETLTLCKCKNAMEERNQIRELVGRNIKEEDILKTINDKYGGLKKGAS